MTPGRVLLVLNVHSRTADKHADVLIGGIRDAGAELLGDRPFSPYEFTDALRELGGKLRPQSDRIVIGGGDGTINSLLEKLVDKGVPLGVLPLGTANDLARTLGIPVKPLEALDTALHGRVVRIDLGKVNTRLFVNVASIGLGPTVTERLSARLKSGFGVIGYPVALLSAYRDSKPFRCRIELDDGSVHRVRAIHLAVGNGRFYGGGVTVFAEAAIDNRRLDLFSVSPVPFWRLLLAAPWLRFGRHHEVDDVHCLHAETISIETSRKMPISADGEIIGETPARFELVPDALAVSVPRDTDIPGLNASVKHD